jgi:hypothetical protein
MRNRLHAALGCLTFVVAGAGAAETGCRDKPHYLDSGRDCKSWAGMNCRMGDGRNIISLTQVNFLVASCPESCADVTPCCTASGEDCPIGGQSDDGRTCGFETDQCLESKCCVNEPEVGCYKRRGRTFAMCRKAPGGQCAQSDDWQCPGTWEHLWDACAAKYSACGESRCCQDDNFGCYRRATTPFAQCRPMPANRAPCINSDMWLCPDSWEANHDVKEAAGSLRQVENELELLARLGSAELECTENYGNCLGTHCCKDRGFHCYEKFGVNCTPKPYSERTGSSERPPMPK